MYKGKTIMNTFKRNSATNPNLLFGVRINLDNDIKNEINDFFKPSNNQNSSSFEDNTKYYDKFLQSLKKDSSPHTSPIKKKNQNTPITILKKDESIKTKTVQKNEFNVRHSNTDNAPKESNSNNNHSSNKHLCLLPVTSKQSRLSVSRKDPIEENDKDGIETMEKQFHLMKSHEYIASKNSNNKKEKEKEKEGGKSNKSQGQSDNLSKSIDESIKKRMSKSIQSKEHSPIKRYKTNKAIPYVPPNIHSPLPPDENKQRISLQNNNLFTQMKNKRRASKDHAKRRWFFCCLPIK